MTTLIVYSVASAFIVLGITLLIEAFILWLDDVL